MTAIRNNTLPSPSETESEEDLNQTREDLRNWVQKNRWMMEIFLDAYCIVDLTNHVVEFNTAFTELCGESYRKVLKVGDFCELLRTELCPHQCPGQQILISGKSLRLDEVTGSSKAFPQLQIILGGVPIHNDAGKLVGALVTIRNVSAESELQKKYYERKEESVIDGLTRLYNKVYAEGLLMRVLKASLRDGQSFSVLMCDIDHFKKVNDTYGHQAGDYVLSTVAQMLKGEARDSDIVGRFGGEEFLVVLPKSDAAGSKIFAERFRKRAELTQIFFEGKQIPVTVSLGTVSYQSKWQPGLDAERCSKDLINKADTALYFAKANGRNQSCQFESLPVKAPVTDKKGDEH